MADWILRTDGPACSSPKDSPDSCHEAERAERAAKRRQHEQERQPLLVSEAGDRSDVDAAWRAEATRPLAQGRTACPTATAP